jgi:multisubunit Na+/H+ antiporter MnhG subunit
MRWSDVTAVPSKSTLRQFAGLLLVFCVGLAGWRTWHGQTGAWTTTLGAGGLVVGVVGLVWPVVLRPIYTGWMVVAFPIGWTVFRLILGVFFYGILTPVAIVMRVMRRDALSLRRPDVRSYWTVKRNPESAASYFRQS